MTNKQIIIDGVDVGGCKYLNTFSDCDGYHYYCDLADDIKNEYCEYYKDCYFKQLARKTTECERSRKRISDLEERIINHSNEIEEYCSRLADKNKKCEKYEQALTEIKEIAEPFCNACQEFEPEKKGSNCMYCNYGKILQKISEVEK